MKQHTDNQQDHPSFAECEKNSKNRTKETSKNAIKECDAIFKELAKLLEN